MRGYLSFVIVLFCLLILFSLLQARDAAQHIDLSGAIAIERAYSLSMDIKGCILEAVRSGATDGFSAYDGTHDTRLCRHCPDSFCSVNPAASNRCDAALCSGCFREREARAQAEMGALSRVSTLHAHVFDADFTHGFLVPELRASTRADNSSRNGYSLDRIVFKREVDIQVASPRLGISAESSIPGGVVISYEGTG